LIVATEITAVRIDSMWAIQYLSMLLLVKVLKPVGLPDALVPAGLLVAERLLPDRIIYMLIFAKKKNVREIIALVPKALVKETLAWIVTHPAKEPRIAAGKK